MVSSIPEEDIMGDVHSIVSACSVVRHQTSLQEASWGMASQAVILCTPPHEEWLQHSRSLVEKTLC
eukprot:942400-Prorocentrum_lima.AAC.1